MAELVHFHLFLCIFDEKLEYFESNFVAALRKFFGAPLQLALRFRFRRAAPASLQLKERRSKSLVVSNLL